MKQIRNDCDADLLKEKANPKVGFFLKRLVGAAGFELATPCTPCKCATRLRYAPTEASFYAITAVHSMENGN
jgi:hypothetical protein